MFLCMRKDRRINKCRDVCCTPHAPREVMRPCRGTLRVFDDYRLTELASSSTSRNGTSASSPNMGWLRSFARVLAGDASPQRNRVICRGVARAGRRSGREALDLGPHRVAGRGVLRRRQWPAGPTLAPAAMPARRRGSRRSRPADAASGSHRPRLARACDGRGRCRALRVGGIAELRFSHRAAEAGGSVPHPVALPHARRLDHQVARLLQVAQRGDDPLPRLADPPATSSRSSENHVRPLTAWRKTLRRNSARRASNCARISCDGFCGWNLYSE